MSYGDMVKLTRLVMLGVFWLDLQCWGCFGWNTLNLLCAFTKNHMI